MQRGNHGPAQNETVLAQKPQRVLPGHAAQTRPAFLHHVPQPDQVVRRPTREKRRRRAVFARQIGQKDRVIPHRQDFLAVPDDAGVAQMRVQILVRHHGVAPDVKTEKGLFEARPLVFHHRPVEARLKHPLGELRQDAVVAQRCEVDILRHRQQHLQHFRPALALRRAVANFSECLHLYSLSSRCCIRTSAAISRRRASGTGRSPSAGASQRSRK